jgi:hypothetical protein
MTPIYGGSELAQTTYHASFHPLGGSFKNTHKPLAIAWLPLSKAALPGPHATESLGSRSFPSTCGLEESHGLLCGKRMVQGPLMLCQQCYQASCTTTPYQFSDPPVNPLGHRHATGNKEP